MMIKFLSPNFRLISSGIAVLALILFLTEPALAVGLKDLTGLPVPSGVPGESLAAENTTPEGAVKTVASLMQRIANGLAALAAAVAVLFVVINGARLTFSFGNTEELGKAKKGLVWAAVGLLLIIFAYIIAKSVIALTYSGADGSSAIGNEQVNAPAVVAEEPLAEEPACKPKPNLPDSCYGGNLTAQTSTGGASCDADAGTALGPVCADLGISGNCSVAAVQGAIDYSKISVPAACQKADGKYGQCTRDAIAAYYGTCIQ